MMGLFNRKKKEKYEGKIFLFSSIPVMDKIVTSIAEHFGIKSDGAGNTLSLNNNDIAVQVLVVSDDLGEEGAEFIKDQVSRTWGHFYQIATDHTDIKTNLLYKIKMTKGLVIIDYSFDGEEILNKKQLIETMFIGVLETIDALMLLTGEDDGFYLGGDDGKRQLILSEQGVSSMSAYYPEQKFELTAGEHINHEQIERRLRSRSVLKEKCILVPAWYPVIEAEEDAVFRTAEETAGRAAALLMVALYSECLLGEGMSVGEAAEFVKSLAERFEADHYLSPLEKKYLSNPDPSESDQINYSWQYENLCVMEWALGLIDELDFPDHICDVPAMVRNMNKFSSLQDLIDQAKMRSQKELLDQCDLIFCLNWACVDTRVNRLPAPAGMESGVAVERHKSLNWLCGYDNCCPWDKVGTDT